MSEYHKISVRISRLKTELHDAEGELVRLQNECKHPSFGSSEWWNEGYKHYERLNICGICGKMWHEHRYD